MPKQYKARELKRGKAYLDCHRIADGFTDLHLSCGNVGKQLAKANFELNTLRCKLGRLEEDFKGLVKVLGMD